MKKYFMLVTTVLSGLVLPALELKAQENEVQVGAYAGQNSKGSDNVYVGSFNGWADNANAVPLPSSTQLVYNTYVGAFTGQANVGIRNTFIGAYSGWENKGEHNTFMGFEAGQRSKGGYNTFIGRGSGESNAGVYNAAMGFLSGHLNKGDFNTFSGYRAGHQNVGNRNTSVGHSAGSFSSGNSNTFLGTEAGGSNRGSFNIMIGEKAGLGNDGHFNVAIGHHAGKSHSLANNNTYLGSYAGEKNQTGSFNVFLGYQSGRNETGSHKLYIADGSSPSNTLLYGDFLKRKLVIGGKIDSDYTLHILGDVYSTGTWTSSDKRFKKNIQPIDKPLEKVLAVNGVSYEFNKDSLRAFHQGKTYGFVAQEVQKVLPALVQSDKQGYLAINYECFIPLLVEAFKEQEVSHQQEIDQLQKQINQLKRLIVQKRSKDDQAHANIPEESLTDKLASETLNVPTVVLHQNIPNPFSQTTTVRYTVPAEARQVALYVYDLGGKPMLQFTNLAAGNGQVNIEAGQLTPGMYLYSLLVDGKVADTKRLILTQ